MKRLALLFPVWLLLAAGENAPVHTCAMHGSHSAPAQSRHQHGAHHGGTPEAPAPTAPCSCVGDCSTPVPPSAPTDVTVPMAAVVATAGVRPVAPGFVVARETPRLLPFANGPPVSAL